MAITATLIKAKEHKTYWKMEVQYDDEGELAIETFRFSGSDTASLISYVASKVTQYNEIKSFDFTTLIGKSINLTPIPDVPPTDEEIAKAAWFSDWTQLKAVNLLLEQAPAIATASRISFRDGLQLSVETNWLDTYLGDL